MNCTLITNNVPSWNKLVMDIFHSLLLGTVQGLTEFLPVSSSGHLVIFQNLLGMHEPEMLFDTALHFGTLLALFIVFRNDVAELITSFFRILFVKKNASITASYGTDETTRLLVLIVVGTVPTVLLGFCFKDLFERLFSSVSVVGCTLLITGALLWFTKYRTSTTKTVMQMTIYHALVIGFIQGLAITPGISRSGSTIAVALFLGIERETSGRFSFLLSMPAVLGATILNFSAATVTTSEIIPIALGTAAAVITGWISLVFLLKLIRQGRFHFFAPYCFSIGMAALFYSLFS